jgi:hypothetical protein
MEDRKHDDTGKKLGAIVDDAIAEILMLGFENRDRAAMAMACQAALRIQDNEIMKEVERFVHDSIWDVDDTQEGGDA